MKKQAAVKEMSWKEVLVLGAMAVGAIWLLANTPSDPANARPKNEEKDEWDTVE